MRSSPDWLRRTAGPPASYLDMLFVDHGIFRMIYGNSHRLSDKAWRAAQPAPHQLRGYAKAGVRTVVTCAASAIAVPTTWSAAPASSPA